MRNLFDDRPDTIGNGNPNMDDVAQHQEHVPFGLLVQEIEIQRSDDHDDQQIGRRVLGHRLHHLLHIGLRHEWNLEQIHDCDHLFVQIDQHQEDDGHHDHEDRHAEPVVFPARQIFRTGRHVGEPQGRPGKRRRRKPHGEYDPDQGDGHMSPIGPAVGDSDGFPLRVAARREDEHQHARKADGADGNVPRKSSGENPDGAGNTIGFFFEVSGKPCRNRFHGAQLLTIRKPPLPELGDATRRPIV